MNLIAEVFYKICQQDELLEQACDHQARIVTYMADGLTELRHVRHYRHEDEHGCPSYKRHRYPEFVVAEWVVYYSASSTVCACGNALCGEAIVPVAEVGTNSHVRRTHEYR